MSGRDRRGRDAKQNLFRDLPSIAVRLEYPGSVTQLVSAFEACLYQGRWPEVGWYRDDDRMHALYKLIHFPNLFEASPEILAIASGIWINGAAGATDTNESEERALLNLVAVSSQIPEDVIAPVLALLLRLWTAKPGLAKGVYGLAATIVLHDVGRRCAAAAMECANELPGIPADTAPAVRLARLSESEDVGAQWLAAIRSRPLLLQEIEQSSGPST